MGFKKSTGSREEAIELKMKGLSYAEIAKRFGVSRQRVQQMIRPPREVYNEVRNRAKGMCQLCFVELKSGHVHHMGTEDWDDWRNLRYLCATCHTALHKNPANGERLRFP
jgi:hypothetical protein